MQNQSSINKSWIVEQDGTMILVKLTMLKRDSGIEFFPKEFEIYFCREMYDFLFSKFANLCENLKKGPTLIEGWCWTCYHKEVCL